MSKKITQIFLGSAALIGSLIACKNEPKVPQYNPEYDGLYGDLIREAQPLSLKAAAELGVVTKENTVQPEASSHSYSFEYKGHHDSMDAGGRVVFQHQVRAEEIHTTFNVRVVCEQNPVNEKKPYGPLGKITCKREQKQDRWGNYE